MAQVLQGPGAGWDWRDPSDTMRERTQQDEAARQRAVARAWAYYDGDMPPQIRVKQGDYDDNVRLEYPALIIDTSVAFLFGANLKFTAEDEGRQELIDNVWGTEEQKMVTLQRLGINGAVSGHAFIKLQPLEDGVRVLVLDPSYVDVDWATDDFTKVLAYHVEWSGYDAMLRRSVSYRQDVTLTEPGADGPWLIEDFRSVGQGDWVQTGAEDWDFPFAPIVDCQNLPTANEFYGNPDLGPADLDLVDRINMAATNIQKILRYHAHPKVFIYGYSGKDIDLSVDSAVNFPSTETSVGILGMPTDLGAAFQMLDRLTDALLRQTRTPRAALGDSEAAAAAASGLALKLSFMPLVDKTGQKRETYGYLLNEVNQRVQAIVGADPSEVELEWPSITPDDPQMEAQTALLKQQVGVAKATTIAELGYDPDIELSKREDEDAAATEAMQKAMADGRFGRVVDEDAGGQDAAQQDRRTRDMLAQGE
jgi:Phage portal protein, SPP1 Gp6-like